jgi:hypothetical protein
VGVEITDWKQIPQTSRRSNFRGVSRGCINPRKINQSHPSHNGRRGIGDKACFYGTESNRQIRLHTGVEHLTSGGIKPRGDVDGDRESTLFPTKPIHLNDPVGKHPLGDASRTYSKQSVEQEERAIDIGHLLDDLDILQLFEMTTSQGSEFFGRESAAKQHTPTSLTKMPSRNQRITAVMSLAVANHDAPRRWKKLADASGDPHTRNLHQSGGSFPSCKGHLLSGFHLRGSHDHEVRLMSGNDPGRIQNVEIRKSGKKH